MVSALILLSILAVSAAMNATQPLGGSNSAEDYYASIDPSWKDTQLRQALHDLINPHIVLSYDGVWEAFKSLGKLLPNYPCSSDASKIADVYSSYCWKTEKVTGGECGNYKKEGDCYNREHLWPKSWYGGFDAGKNAQTDLFELWPSDGYVNGLRGDLPFCELDPMQQPSYNSTNGSRIGKCGTQGYSGKGFEADDELKGDFARSYFYLSTAYYKEWTCCDNEGTNKWEIKPWMESMLRQWHRNDPVNDLERARNDEIFLKWQKNRNPFIDHPEWVDQISDF